VGAYGDDDKGTSSGSAYIFSFRSEKLANAILALQVISAGNSGNVSSLKDVNNDGRIGMEEAIFALQAAAGLR